jgi:hypothetical protein
MACRTRARTTPSATEETLEKLRLFVNESSLSRFAITRKHNVMMPTLSNWLSGRRVPNAESIQKIRHFLQREAGKSEFHHQSSFPTPQVGALRRCPFCCGRIVKVSRLETGKQYAALCTRCKAQGPPAGSKRSKSPRAMEQERSLAILPAQARLRSVSRFLSPRRECRCPHQCKSYAQPSFRSPRLESRHPRLPA